MKLSQDGFRDTRNLTARDLPLIQNRIASIEQLAPNAAGLVNAAAFKEAYKDLLNMRERVTRANAPNERQRRQRSDGPTELPTRENAPTRR